MKKQEKLLALLLLFLMLPCFILPVSANSAQQYWYGTDASGTIITDGESPIVVEHELLTFDITEFPDTYYRENEKFLDYSGNVTAEYTFYNPSDIAVTATLAFPYGNIPSYAGYDCDDTEKYGVTVNGDPISVEVRHTLSNFNYGFILDSDLPLVSDEYLSDGFYSPDMTVTMYSWKAEYDIPAGEIVQHLAIACDFGKSNGERVIYMPNQSGVRLQSDGDWRICASANYASPILYVFGEPLEKMPEWRLYRDGSCKDGDELSAEFSFFEKKTMTLLDFALQNRPEDSPVSELDWYNATVTDLKTSNKGIDFPIVSITRYEDRFSRYMMRWYQYEITLAPSERIVNTVTAPMYPSIDMSYTPAIYEYTYLLSPASTWAEFGKLDILINTDYYLTDSNLGGFEKSENGYRLFLDGLPKDENGRYQELTFTLSTEENPVPDSQTPAEIIKNITYFLLFFGPIILIGVAAVVVLIILILILKRIFRR